jgi:hypothetical protein
MTAHVSGLSWSKYLADDMSWWERRTLLRHARACAACERSRVEMDRERESWRQSPARADELQRLLARLPARRQQPVRWRGILVSAATAVAFMAAVVLLPGHGLKGKGSDIFIAYAKHGNTVRVLGERCAPGELIRFHYETGHAYLAVVERDARGSLSILVPSDGPQARLRGPAGETDGSWRLDGAIGLERFFGVFSDRPLSQDELLAAFAGGEPQLAGASVSALSCRKEGN